MMRPEQLTGETPGGDEVEPMPTAIRRRLTGFRVVAWTVGVFLIVLAGVGMPLKYLFDDDIIVAIVGPIHGFGYMIYLAVTAELAFRARWAWSNAVMVLLAGTIPFLSFVAERTVVTRMRAGRRL